MAAKKKHYRLEALLKLKERAKRQTEILLAKVIKELEEEKQKLERLKEKKKEIQTKREKARTDMRDKVAKGQSRVKESHFHLAFIEKLKEDEMILEEEIKEQMEAIKQAEDKLKRARRDYRDAASELNVMQKHKELWIKKEQKALNALENKQMNELGNIVHQINKMGAL